MCAIFHPIHVRDGEIYFCRPRFGLEVDNFHAAERGTGKSMTRSSNLSLGLEYNGSYISLFDDVQEVKDIKFHLIKKKYVGLDLNIYAKIRKQARKLRTTEDALINEWLREKAEA